MPYIIMNECINCLACRIECPNDAIAEPINTIEGNNSKHDIQSMEHYIIDQEKCDECFMLANPKCIDICPMDAIEEI